MIMNDNERPNVQKFRLRMTEVVVKKKLKFILNRYIKISCNCSKDWTGYTCDRCSYIVLLTFETLFS